MRICVAISGFSSMLSLTMRTAPLAPRTTFSRIGPNCLHGPHHGAQKSTMIGWSNEASTTSAIKLAVVTSWTAAAPAAAPPPIKGSFAMRYAPWGYNANMAAGRRDGKRRRGVRAAVFRPKAGLPRASRTSPASVPPRPGGKNGVLDPLDRAVPFGNVEGNHDRTGGHQGTGGEQRDHRRVPPSRARPGGTHRAQLSSQFGNSFVQVLDFRLRPGEFLVLAPLQRLRRLVPGCKLLGEVLYLLLQVQQRGRIRIAPSVGFWRLLVRRFDQCGQLRLQHSANIARRLGSCLRRRLDVEYILGRRRGHS